MTTPVFDEYTNIADHQGKAHTNLDYTLRAELFQKLTPEEYKAFQLGRSDEETIKKAQEIYDNWHNEKHPSEEVQWERLQKSRAENTILNLKIQLKHKEGQLDKLNKMAERDEVLPIGERQKLKTEISNLTREMQVAEMSSGVKAKDVENPEGDWFDSLL